RALAAASCGDREIVGVFILGVALVAPDPGPLDLVQTDGLGQVLPQLEILDRAGFPDPAAGGPAGSPFPHAFDQIFGIGDHEHTEAIALTGQNSECGNSPTEGHPVIGGIRHVGEKVPALYLPAGSSLDEATCSSRVLT